MTGLDRQIAAWCEGTLGPHAVLTTASSLDHRGRVVRVRDTNGDEYIVKIHGSRQKHQREIRAYRQWLGVLHGRVPRLVAVEPTLRVIIVSAVPGTPVPSTHRSPTREAGLHRQAGELLDRLHHAIPARQRPELTNHLIKRASWWLGQAADLLPVPDHRFIQHHLTALTDLGPLDAVVCHLDYQPRNWLVDEIGILRVIDFEHTRIDLRPRDLVRLNFRSWIDRPDLRDAFLVGYGRRLTDTETLAVSHCAAIDVLTALVRGNTTDNPSLTEYGRATLSRLREDAASP